MVEVGIFDLSYYIARGEEKTLESFADKFMRMILDRLLFDISAQAFYDSCAKTKVKAPDKAIRFILENSNFIRGFFFELAISCDIPKAEYYEFGKILEHLPFNNPHWGPLENQFDEFNEKLHHELYTVRFNLINSLAQSFAEAGERKIFKKIPAVKLLVYFLKTRQKILYEKFSYSLLASGFSKKKEKAVIKSMKKFFSGKGRESL